MDVDARLRALRAYATHAFTATGAVFAFLALLAAVESRWSEMFGWLLVAFVVDGVDGALARRTDVVTHAPIIDGSLLDLVIDFLTYVFIPVFALVRAGLLDGAAGRVTALVVFATELSSTVMVPVAALLTLAMFVEVKFIHPVRTARWRRVSLPVAVAWTAVAGWAALSDFATPRWAAVVLLASSLYLALAGAAQQLLDLRARTRMMLIH